MQTAVHAEILYVSCFNIFFAQVQPCFYQRVTQSIEKGALKRHQGNPGYPFALSLDQHDLGQYHHLT